MPAGLWSHIGPEGREPGTATALVPANRSKRGETLVARVRLVTIAVALCGALGMAVPSLAAAGSISGTVSAEGGGPIQGVEVCT